MKPLPLLLEPGGVGIWRDVRDQQPAHGTGDDPFVGEQGAKVPTISRVAGLLCCFL